jgi:ribosomal protein S12 methylthiotransferase
VPKKAPSQAAAPRKIHFVSLGCPKNRVDSEVMLGVAAREGFAVTDEPAEAEVIVVNTCGFIGEAKRESIETIFELGAMKEHGACEKLVVSGCLSQRYPTELAAQMPEVDHFLGSSDMLRLGEVLRGDAERMLVGNPADWVVRATDPRVVTGPRSSAWVKIAEGCNRKCSFCVIPQLRGLQRSRPADDIVREVERLVGEGVREVNLVSQDTMAYGSDLDRDDVDLASLVARVADVKGLRWLRLFYLYPEKVNEPLLDLLANHPIVLPYVDMPLQHAADAMLRRMRRGCGKDRQKRVVETMRARIPNLTFRTAFIVGHPGETDEEFEELCEFVRWARFERMGVFRYSDEETSHSASLGAKVSGKTAASRWRKLMTIQRRISREANRALVGTELDVLVAGPSDEHDLVMEGRHRGQAPDIDGKVYLSGGVAAAGEIRRVRIAQASDYDLVGDLVDADGAPKKKRRVGLRVVSA